MLEKYALIKAIQALTAKPAKSFSVRGLAAEARLSPGAARTALDFMRKKGIASLKVVGKTFQYRANLESPFCRQWKILFNLEELVDAKIAEEIANKIPQVHCILLYGSFAKGTNDEKSDIDLLVVAQGKSKADLGFANKFKREANISILSLQEWKRKALEDKVFYENVIYDSIVLHGERPVVL
ncbi:MAG: nucleotidyltransferase domain-containing protein [Candidatus Diapherotrites archaeon]|uniref:Nucleotidyltransferase domain-containing protein n=1 Tax=Candidatus Iainarchaeum sp. TaxID=3101447 RepID=A0A7J4KSM2_9ARCH|nr:MAG: nucleotidytransferase [archaeon GW2011_AR21]MBS3058337.1 nucleotidyltransferase domain-containing protein [Candidatus Diapherotrites archaeon]HIH32983.1 nucleotidyltransferase domain-containing protein [Candidatus Diapherotrites archaeon]